MCTLIYFDQPDIVQTFVLTHNTRRNLACTHIVSTKRVKLAYVLQSHIASLETYLAAMGLMRPTATLLHLILPPDFNIGHAMEDRGHDSAGQQHTSGCLLSPALAVLTYQRTSHVRRKPSIFHWPPSVLIVMVRCPLELDIFLSRINIPVP